MNFIFICVYLYIFLSKLHIWYPIIKCIYICVYLQYMFTHLNAIFVSSWAQSPVCACAIHPSVSTKTWNDISRHCHRWNSPATFRSCALYVLRWEICVSSVWFCAIEKLHFNVCVFRSLEHFWSLIGMRLYTCIDLVRLWNISKGRSRSINFIFRNGWFHSTFAGPFFKYRYFYFCVKNMFRLFFFHFDFEW